MSLTPVMMHLHSQSFLYHPLHLFERILRAEEVNVATAAHQRMRIQRRHRLTFHHGIFQLPTVQERRKPRHLLIHVPALQLMQPLHRTHVHRLHLANGQVTADDRICHQSAHTLVLRHRQDSVDVIRRHLASQLLPPQLAPQQT